MTAPTQRRKIPAETAVWAALIGALLLLSAVTFATFRATAGMGTVLAEFDRIRLVAVASSRLLSDFRESQSDRRAYLLSGDPYFLAQYETVLKSARNQLLALDSVTHSDSTQRTGVQAVVHLMERADSFAQRTIRVRQTRGLEAAAALVRTREGETVSEEIERSVIAIQTVEQQRLALALSRARARAVRASGIAIASSVLALLLLPGAWLIIWRDLQARRQASRALGHAKLAAESATRAKSEFLASMSHEIRTPLNGVLGMTELALDTDLTPTQRDYLLTARSSAESLLRLLNDILDFSKIEAGRLDIEHAPFSLRDVLGETLRTLAVRAEQRKLELAYRVLPAVPDILVGDAGRLQQVVVNLVGNAIKFTERGEIVVVVEAQPTSRAETVIHVRVRDTGIGIPADRTRAIFDLFSQADRSTTRRFGGTGLGLTISEQLVKLMGGSIWVESVEGQGSTFHFTAKLGVGEQAPLPRATLEQLEGLRVLVLDDHPTNRLILEEMLGQWRMQPFSAPTGAEAIRVTERAKREGRPIQVGIFDNLLPDTDGYSVAERLSSAGLLQGSSIIILSSDNQPGNAARRASLGISRALMKPVKQSELLDAILTAAAGAGVAPPQHKPPAQRGRWSGASVLVVEDNEVNQRVARGLLEKRGISVTVANNGREALERLQHDHDFQLVLMDVEMPEMDGLEATRRIRESEGGHSRIPIVAVTAHALREERQRCEEAGMDECRTKPLRAKELDEVLERFLPATGTDDALLASMLDIVDGDRELLSAIAGAYLRQTPVVLAQLEGAVARKDALAVARAAHKLRGSSLQLAGTAVGDVAGRLEDSSSDGDLSDAAAMMGEIRTQATKFMKLVATVSLP